LWLRAQVWVSWKKVTLASTHSVRSTHDLTDQTINYVDILASDTLPVAGMDNLPEMPNEIVNCARETGKGAVPESIALEFRALSIAVPEVLQDNAEPHGSVKIVPLIGNLPQDSGRQNPADRSQSATFGTLL
jgi:hypothetical protein